MSIKNTTLLTSTLISGVAVGVVVGAISVGVVVKPKLVVTAVPQIFSTLSAAEMGPPVVPIKERVARCKQWKECSSLARAVVYEARGESAIGQAAVAHVILNRSLHPDFPDSIPSVIKEPKQFSFYGYEWKQKAPRKQDWDNAYSISYDVLTGTIEDVTLGSTFYATLETSPKRLGNVEYVMTIDKHKFYTVRNSDD